MFTSDVWWPTASFLKSPIWLLVYLQTSEKTLFCTFSNVPSQVSNGRLYCYCTKCTVVTLHSTNRRLQCYNVQMQVQGGAVSIAICTTMWQMG